MAQQSSDKPQATLTNNTLTRQHMPEDFSISLANYVRGGTDGFLLQPRTERQQAMKGFEEEYTDIIDYIVRITHRIWEEGDIGLIYDYYRHNSRVYDDFALQYGRDKIVADTVTTINAFPDIRLYADEIVWAGDEQVGFYTSHRTVIMGHNTGFSRYGPPTGKKVHVWCIANCLAVENEIYEEWVLYNNSALITQLGFDLFQRAGEMKPVIDLSGLKDPRFGEPTRLPGQGKPAVLPPPESRAFDVEDFVRRLVQDVWNRRMLGRLNDHYITGVRYHGATNREYYSVGMLRSFILSLIAMFPDLAMQIDHIYWMGNDQDGYLTSVRWSITGTHRGPGIYGDPTGKPVYMWGISQHHLRQGKIMEEWTLFNEFAVLQQLLS